MKKILFVHTRTNGGGAEKVIMNIYNSLDDAKYQKKYISLYETFSSDSAIVGLGSKSVSRSFAKLQKAIADYEPDLVFSTMVHVALLVNLLRLFNNFKFVHVSRMASSVTNPFASRYDNLIKWLFTKTLRKHELLICQTQQMKEAFIEGYHVKESNILVVRNYLDVKSIDQLKDEFVTAHLESGFKIISLGRIDRIKGFEYGIKAVKELCSQGLDVTYCIYGDVVHSDYHQELIRLISESDLEGRVCLCGNAENPYPYLKNSDLLLLPSLSEGFPNVVIEALYLGVPVVVTDCSDFSGIIEEGKNGYVVARESILPMAIAIKNSMGLKHHCFPFSYVNFDYNALFEKKLNLKL